MGALKRGAWNPLTNYAQLKNFLQQKPELKFWPSSGSNLAGRVSENHCGQNP